MEKPEEKNCGILLYAMEANLKWRTAKSATKLITILIPFANTSRRIINILQMKINPVQARIYYRVYGPVCRIFIIAKAIIQLA